MDKVLTINDWQDGPLSGIASYGNETCIYERIFSTEKDDYLDQYYLTPISDEQKQRILDNWQEWILWMASDHSQAHAVQWHSSDRCLDIDSIAKHSPDYHKYVKSAEFHGRQPTNFYSAIQDYYVTWN